MKAVIPTDRNGLSGQYNVAMAGWLAGHQLIHQVPLLPLLEGAIDGGQKVGPTQGTG